ncbi:histidine phosphatase family protein [Alkalicoccus daliensis]|uniref:Histidine phosphatase superfamily (Branch 1) n=1 Tax=Alkalicoccus daliensis TaxID=745820 RepID=A0A1G9ZED9_9BACI|nr:histidine phosphatase family protein [Alkalicoccus daliensis]SDN19594.1 Histidine phosphatase superfamily (branch 1) [Alkalicoccus daliensis]
MEINLIRHGKSLYSDKTKINMRNYENWSRNYDSSGVHVEKNYPLLTIEKVKTSELLLTSNLKRTKDSAAYLSPEASFVSSSLFRETELPVLQKFEFLKIKPIYWDILLRLLWLGGCSTKCESYKEAKYRAVHAADSLVEFAENYSKITLIGHGFFNYLISKELKKKKWKGNSRISFKNWECTTYQYKNMGRFR